MLLILYMKKIVLCMMFALVVSGCSKVLPKSTEQTVQEVILPSEQYSFFEHAEFRIQYPVSFEILKQNQLKNKFSNQAMVAFLSNQKSDFFTSNIVVEKVDLTNNIASEVFAESIIENNKKQLQTYRELDRKLITSIVNSQAVTTTMIRFEGRLQLTNDLVEYVQVYLTNSNSGYIATASYDPLDSNLEAEKLIDSLKTFILN